MRIGVVGCGSICGIYLQNLARFAETEVVAVADLELDKAGRVAASFGVPQVLGPQDLLRSPDVDLVLNLTVPAAHHAVTMEGLAAGKHVYVEKPLALTREEGASQLALAQDNGLAVGCAPDTVLGAGIQTCRKLIDQGAIGEPVGGHAFMLCPGHESWHPSPAFYYARGGGPLFDMGPYYLSALVTLLGPIASVQAMARSALAERLITSEPLRGRRIPVETPTHVMASLVFESGPIVGFTASFDVQASTLPHIELYGTEGSLLVPDPNGFGGPVRLRRKGDADWDEVPLEPGPSDNARGLGVAEMVQALASGRPPRAGGELALHVLDVMQSALESAEMGHGAKIQHRCARPQQMSQEGIPTRASE